MSVHAHGGVPWGSGSTAPFTHTAVHILTIHSNEHGRPACTWGSGLIAVTAHTLRLNFWEVFPSHSLVPTVWAIFMFTLGFPEQAAQEETAWVKARQHSVRQTPPGRASTSHQPWRKAHGRFPQVMALPALTPN